MLLMLLIWTLIFFLSVNCKILDLSHYNPSYSNEHYGHNQTDFSNDADYTYDNYTSRIRFFKAIEVNVNITIDIQLSFPLPNDVGSIDLDIPISILIQNKTIFKIPYPDPPLKVPLFYPVIKLPKLPSFLSSGQGSNEPYADYSNDQALYDYFSHPKHQLAKRSLAAQSAQHRFEIFRSIENSLDNYGYHGRSCLLKAICQLAQRELLIESVMHELIEHLLTVSRSVDEDLLRDYVQAEKYGEKHEHCQGKYSCPFSLFQKL